MVHRKQEGEEALRWKRKFLDALEEHEQREKSFSNRIRLLRRGLLGVSLAGDGNDPVLDKQLTQLRSSLRNDDRETGLEILLEQIEKSIIRLDTEKNASTWALQQAFESSIKELEQVPLPASSRRQIKKFNRGLSSRLEDPQQHAGLIRQFIELLSESVQTLKTQEQQATQQGPAQTSTDNAANTSSTGLWQRLFGRPDTAPSAKQEPSAHGEPSANREPSARQEPSADKEPSARQEPSAHGEPSANKEPSADTAPPLVTETDVISGELMDRDDAPSAPRSHDHRSSPLQQEPASYAESYTEVADESDAVNDTRLSGRATDLQDSAVREQQARLEPDDEAGIEGELIRDRSGLAEPAFSFIAGHVEPLLLRILESINITGESVELADSIRRHILKGLNWYDFVAVLEEILQILRSAADDQRIDFQDFLAEVNESLAQVQSFVDSSRQYADQSAATDAALDAKMREQISGISNAVADAGVDLDSLKVSVQSQIGSIISSLDNFKSQRQQQSNDMSQEMGALIERISALETESRELRQHLSQQQEKAQTDTLTDLPNREAYNHRLDTILGEWREGASHERRDDDRALCLAVADVDSFKHINDTYGHLAGDKVLKIISKEMLSRLREKDFIARYGGEEFVIIMPDTRPADAEHALNKVREAIAKIPFHFKEQQLRITVSFGVTDALHDDFPETLFERADRALYQAKKDGRNLVRRHRHED
ncbi:hypothetical protein PHACT_09355 [Pseudohongiella acticola]|uniref:diguanylate cyclase n=1 Tax=Pseudohongiella acticola TaxID=1524254 RepID=A0A1E8CLL8_9GAMM|nr:diguanylate cyclase [Pseudohongiella acticola]OFE13319.1 hypothetical protein PHACT_09355 [Pseudohongiella acticola]